MKATVSDLAGREVVRALRARVREARRLRGAFIPNLGRAANAARRKLGKANAMFTIAMRTIFVGCPPPQVTAILTRLGRVGFGSYAVDSLKEGRDLVETGGFELVLTLEKQQDGNGYELTSPVIRHGGSLFIGVEVSVGYLWLPVVDHGERVLGTSAMDYRLLELELVDVLTHRSERAKAMSRWVPPAAPKVLELKASSPAVSRVVGREERRQKAIAEVPVPTVVARRLRVVPTEAAAVEIKPENDKPILPSNLSS